MTNTKFKVVWKDTKIIDGPFSIFELFEFLGEYSKSVADCIEVIRGTGLKDLDGDEIYEGNIVKGSRPEHFSVSGDFVAEVVEKDGCFFIKDEKVLGQTWTSNELGNQGVNYNLVYQMKNLKVIGNIYQNPELLK